MNAIDRAASTDIFALIGFAKGVLIGCRFDEPHRQRAVAEAIAKLDDATDALAKHFPEPAERADQPVTERDWTIADCYATDPENWRDPWLLRIGFKPDDEQDYLWINSGHGCMFDLQAMAAGPWRLADEEGVIEIPRPKTRSDVLRLLAALGIPTPPQEQARG